MLISRLKPIGEISDYLQNCKSTLLLACNGCGESFGNAETQRLRYLDDDLKKEGICTVDTFTVDFLCEPMLIRHWLGVAEAEADFDSLLVVSCGIGVQMVSKETILPTFPACNTVNMGGRLGQSWRKETCKECGECILPYTGGICPLTACSKGLLNGPCGGSKNGRCEVCPETRECGWNNIYERLKALGKTELLSGGSLVKDYSKSEPSEELVALRNEILFKEIQLL